MKKLFLLYLLISPFIATAATPTDTCPNGFITVTDNTIITDETSCPTGYAYVEGVDYDISCYTWAQSIEQQLNEILESGLAPPGMTPEEIRELLVLKTRFACRLYIHANTQLTDESGNSYTFTHSCPVEGY